METKFTYHSKNSKVDLYIRPDEGHITIEINGKFAAFLGLDYMYDFIKTTFERTTIRHPTVMRRKLQMEVANSPEVSAKIVKTLRELQDETINKS